MISMVYLMHIALHTTESLIHPLQSSAFVSVADQDTLTVHDHQLSEDFAHGWIIDGRTPPS